jgi:hypothetical protein
VSTGSGRHCILHTEMVKSVNKELVLLVTTAG